MVDRPPSNIQIRNIVITPAVLKTKVDFDATVSTSDTITLANIGTLANAVLVKQADGTAVTCTVATNVIAITQATLTNVPITGIAYST